MLKIGIVGGAKFWHTKSFSEMINGYDAHLARQNKFPLYKTKLEGARITHIWDQDAEAAKLVAKICYIGNVLSNMMDMLGEVDAVIIADDTTMQHQKRAIPFIRAGLPTFIDKPLSPSIEEAEDIINLAKEHNAPLMSCSALRYAKEVEEFLSGRGEIGDIMTGNSICSGDLIFYGIHALEQLYVCIGPGIRCVQNVGEDGKDIVIVTKGDGRKFVLTVYRDISYLFQMNLYGTKGWREIRVEDSDHFYSNMLRAFLKMVETKQPSFSPEETLEIIKTLVLGKRSVYNKGEILYL
ncbi:MAG: Gfo/Idh/MocA family protein [Thermoproteota archaeon]